jgi:hypothetical protein
VFTTVILYATVEPEKDNIPFEGETNVFVNLIDGIPAILNLTDEVDQPLPKVI